MFNQTPRYHIKIHPDQLKSVQENEVNRFCSALTLKPPAKIKVTETGIRLKRLIVPTNKTGVE